MIWYALGTWLGVNAVGVLLLAWFTRHNDGSASSWDDEAQIDYLRKWDERHKARHVGLRRFVLGK